MIRNLRKGTTSFVFNHQHGSDLIAAVNTQVEIADRQAVLRATVKPVDGNQRFDADQISENDARLLSIGIDDEFILKKLYSILDSNKERIDSCWLELAHTHTIRWQAAFTSTLDNGVNVALDV
ncbi:MAG: hypothetical protein ACJAW7_002419 [Candidatus Azotimanducaceae bacterium]|jgi:hypothetical protein